MIWSRRSADGRWYPIQVVGLREQGVIYYYFVRHGNVDRIIYVNDPYYAAYSTKDLRVKGKAHIPNIYMKLADLLLCQSVQNFQNTAV